MLREFLRNWSPVVPTGPGVRQAGALPYTVIEGRAAFLLITSRHTGRWIFPKGGIMEGLTPWESAAQEALEEAGVTGAVATEPVGSYRSALNDNDGTLVDVDMYPLRVDTQLDEWDEMDQRLRHWAILGEAKRLLADRSLSRLAETLHRQLVGGGVSR
jgi:8-oxo-dGTP pyrophosphatase MutT (NUDIX family)